MGQGAMPPWYQSSFVYESKCDSQVGDIDLLYLSILTEIQIIEWACKYYDAKWVL